MRVILDGQCFNRNGDSSRRGIGRYSFMMTESLLREWNGPVSVLLNSETDLDVTRFPRARKIELPFTEPLNGMFNRELLRFSLDVGEFDLVHVLSPIEPEHVAVPILSALPKRRDPKLIATLYDLIPLVFDKHYLDNEDTRRNYMDAIEIYRRADRILSISEASKRDAVKFLNINPDVIDVLPPVRSPLAAVQGEPSLFADVTDKYLLYTGGDDYRKNLDGLIKAIGVLAASGYRDVSVKIACKVSEDTTGRIMDLARRLGVDNQVELLGYVSDEVLISLYRRAYAFIFPSLYEGLGMPVLEAMSYGLPILCSDTSSMPEIVGDSALLFDPYQPESIAQSIRLLYTETGLRGRLADSAYRRYREIPFDEMGARVASAYRLYEGEKRRSRRVVAMGAPWPPMKSGISDYAQRLESKLKDFVDVVRITEADGLDEVVRKTNASDAIVLHMGNSEYHDFIWENIIEKIDRKYIGILHDVYLSGYWYHNSVVTRNNPQRYVEELRVTEGEDGAAYGKNVIEGYQGFDQMKYMMNSRFLQRASSIVVHSEWARNCLKSHPWVLKIEFPISYTLERADKRPRDRIVIGVFGHIASTKLPFVILDVFKRITTELPQMIELVFVGEGGTEMERAISDRTREFGIDKNVRITGYVSETELNEWLDTVHLAINLRWPYKGESSASLADTLGAGVPTIVSQVGAFDEVPDDVVVKISAGEDVIQELYNKLCALVGNEGTRVTLRKNSLMYAEAHSWERVIEEYLNVMWMNMTEGFARETFDSIVTSITQMQAFALCWQRTIHATQPWKF